MGAFEFTVSSNGKTAKEAFRYAVEEAQYESGHGGYTGTIAEKDTFVMLDLEKVAKDAIKFYETAKKAGQYTEKHCDDLIEELKGNSNSSKAHAAADYLLEIDDSSISDKWGPAGCFKIEDEKFLFFGWASS